MTQYKKLPIVDLINDVRYQRDLDDKRVAKIASDFDIKLLGVLEVSRRNGKCAVVDGQHRLHAAQMAGLDKVPCLVHTNLTPQEEADMFIRLQDGRKAIHPVERFRAAVFAGDETACQIQNIVTQCDYRIALASGRDAGQYSAIAAVAMLQRVHKRDMLIQTLQALGSIWRGDYKATDAYLIEGLSFLVEGYENRLDGEALDRLRQVTPVDVIRRAAGQAVRLSSNPVSRAQIVATELRKISGVKGRPSARVVDTA